MAMVLLERRPIQQWLDEHHGGDELIAFTRVTTPTNYQVTDVSAGGSNLGSMEVSMQLLALDEEKKSWLLGGRAGLLTLTRTHFYLLRLGGMKEKIKATVFDAPRAQLEFAVHDLSIGRLDWRHWLVMGLPDGEYLLELQVLGKSGKPSKVAPGSDAFRVELGDRVQQLSIDAPRN